MTALATGAIHAGPPEVRPHRTREGRLDYVTVQREPDGVVRVLGWYDSPSSAQRALERRATAPLVVQAVATAASVATRLIRPLLIH